MLVRGELGPTGAQAEGGRARRGRQPDRDRPRSAARGEHGDGVDGTVDAAQVAQEGGGTEPTAQQAGHPGSGPAGGGRREVGFGRNARQRASHLGRCGVDRHPESQVRGLPVGVRDDPGPAGRADHEQRHAARVHGHRRPRRRPRPGVTVPRWPAAGSARSGPRRGRTRRCPRSEAAGRPGPHADAPRLDRTKPARAPRSPIPRAWVLSGWPSATPATAISPSPSTAPW